MSAVAEASELISATAAAAGPAVVGLGPGWRGGSGLVVADGRVLTAAHNLRGDRTGVVFADGRRERAEILGVDRDIDLAVLAVATGSAAPLEAAAEAGGIGAPVVGLAPARRSYAARHPRIRLDRPARSPGIPWPPNPGHRAHRPTPARLVRRSAAGR
jgi:Trypsin-like peptidase domain